MYVEEICLSATADDSVAEVSPEDREKVATLEQVNRMRRSRSVFTLFNDHCLSIETMGLMRDSRNFTIDIGILDPCPKRSLEIAWNYLLVFLLLGGAAWLSAFNGITTYPVLARIILAACAGISLVLAIYRSHDRLVFYSQHGRVPLVVLFNRLPGRAMFDSFTGILVDHINDARVQNTGTNETLSAELKEHRRLMEEGVISGKRYEIVKKHILGQHRY